MTGRADGNIYSHGNRERRRVGLPECVQLVFYPRPKDASSKVDIDTWEVAEERDRYHVISINAGGKNYLLHSGIVAIMQEEDFIETNR